MLVKRPRGAIDEQAKNRDAAELRRHRAHCDVIVMHGNDGRLLSTRKMQ